MELEINENKVECPVCGQVILDMDEGESTPCEHVKLIFSDACGEIVYTSDELEKEGEEMSEKMIDTDSDYDTTTLLEGFAKKNKLEICEVTTSGICCGPCSITEYYLIDMSETFKPKKAKKSKKGK